ncbi:MAG: MATE family efflux transporter [Ruminococcaceae bacterium]|nr:MATE family efflux transporter [Oscillospiraceae bacterium]
MKTDNTELFEKMPVSKSVITLIIPTVISQIITVIYNMADTFFIGQMNDPHRVAAATLIMPPFIMLTGIANLFGIGGSSLISRSLGVGDTEKAKKCAAFSIWTSAAVALAYGLLIYFLRPVIFPFLGADGNTFGYCADYVLWTIGVGSVPTVLNACLAHLVRAEGYSKESSFGVALGGVLNIILDPIFMFPLRMGLIGAAVATMLSNVIATLYFIILLHKNREKTVIKFSLRNYSLKRGIPKEILLVGFPSFVMNLMSIVSNTVLNKMVVSYSNQAIAGMGIAKKIDMLAFAIANGMTQGVLPLIGYNYAAKNHSRMRATIKTSFVYSIAVAFVGAVLLFTCAVPVMRFFIDDSETVAYGQNFLRIICTTCPAITVTMMIVTIFQATGQKVKPMILSLLRKGCVDIPFMIIMDAIAGANGIPWATPISDIIAMSIAIILFIPYWKKVNKTILNSFKTVEI